MALNFRPHDLARRPVTGQAFLGAPETSITGLNPPGGERPQPDGLLRNNAGGMNEHTTV